MNLLKILKFFKAVYTIPILSTFLDVSEEKIQKEVFEEFGSPIRQWLIEYG